MLTRQPRQASNCRPTRHGAGRSEWSILIRLTPSPSSQINLNRRRKILAILKDENYKEYARNAAHWLEMLAIIKDPESRTIQRKMAAEWMRLADIARRPSRRR